MPKIRATVTSQPPADPSPAPIDTTLGNPVRRANKAAYGHSDTPRHHADDYPTPRGFVLPLLDHLALPRSTKVWDPCAGGGHLVATLRERFDLVYFDDLHYSSTDFLTAPLRQVDWVVTNPPYRHAEAFVRRALEATPNVAMLMNTAFLEGVGRSTGLFTEHPPARILLCNRRMRLSNGVSSTFSHVWMVWLPETQLTHLDWLHLQRDDLVMPTGADTNVWKELQ